ncbi:MAG: hypothetical protein KGD68_12775 [Candidatus Lokiarchaeota archaeon]|nr:hypothetical protein [Candidatus Lokiarchaeota archaeon]
MRLPKRYLKKVAKKRLIDFILMIFVVSLTFFGVFMMEAKSGTGILYHLGDNWYIDPYYLQNNNDLGYYLGISNSESFPNVLIPENNGEEVHYIHNTPNPTLAFWGPHFVWLYSLDLVPVFIFKQSVLYFSIAISSIVVFTYLFLNRKSLPITNKLLK